MSMTTRILRVTGMTCDHCVTAVTDELTAVPGVEGVTVSVVPGGISEVAVTADASVTQEQCAAAINEAGYDISI